MTNEPKTPRRDSASVDDIRDELRDELLRAAPSHAERRRLGRRRLGLSAAAILIAAIPTTLAVAELVPDEEPQLAEPAPTPFFAPGGAFADCPDEVQELLLRNLDDLSRYANGPGYPVAGCPTVEEVGAAQPSAEEVERADSMPDGVRTLELAPER